MGIPLKTAVSLFFAAGLLSGVSCRNAADPDSLEMRLENLYGYTPKAEQPVKEERTENFLPETHPLPAGKTEAQFEPAPSVSSFVPLREKTHVVKPGESLWLIALKEYDDGFKWRLIYEANRDLLKGNPNNIRPQMKLRIPPDKK